VAEGFASVAVGALFATGIGETLVIVGVAGAGAVIAAEGVDLLLTSAWRHWDDVKGTATRAGGWATDRANDLVHDSERAGGWVKDRALDGWHAVTRVFG
jgi:hypothetical protein